MTTLFMKQMQAMMRREEFKKVESKLQPCPVVNGCEILHRHSTNGKIYFSAWKKDSRVNTREIEVNKQHVLQTENIYEAWKIEFFWLTHNN